MSLWSKKNCIHCWWKRKTVKPLWKKIWNFLTKLNILLAYDSAIIPLRIYLKELKIYVHTKTSTWVLLAALNTVAKMWKQPRCPLVREWINKLWYFQTMEYSSALKRNELSSHEKTWRKLKCVLLSKRDQS